MAKKSLAKSLLLVSPKSIHHNLLNRSERPRNKKGAVDIKPNSARQIILQQTKYPFDNPKH